MYRFFCRKKRVIRLLVLFGLCACLIFFISDDSLKHHDHKTADRQGKKAPLQFALALRGHALDADTPHNLTAKQHRAMRRKEGFFFALVKRAKKEAAAEKIRQKSGHLKQRPKAKHLKLRRKAGHIKLGRKRHSTKVRRKEGKLRRKEGKLHRKAAKLSRKLGKIFRKGELKNPEDGWIQPPNAGEDGQPVVVQEKKLSKEQQVEYYRGNKRHHFNQFLSDRISLHRSVPKVKDPECGGLEYSPDLPSASVVIIFHNEAWSALLRTVHSVLDRSPPSILQEVILVDDFSDLEHLKKPLERYLQRPGLSKVKLLRLPSRDGLMKARLMGLSKATSSAVVFLDSHCECFDGWLEPLLDPIAKDPTTVTLPVIDAIDSKTFGINVNFASAISVGTFSWSLLFNWMPIQPGEKRRRKSDVDPIRSPTMAGGLFAIDRNYFYTLGTYDPGMKIWGGENLELSFKIWMCGGKMETVPCSHVGHVFRSASPHSSGGFRNYLSVNLARLAAVWMDDYIFYNFRSRGITNIDAGKQWLKNAGDISERTELKLRLKCHSFGWFMKHVMPEIYLPADYIAHGQIENELTGLCIVSDEKTAVLEKCEKDEHYAHDDAVWYMNPDQSTVFQGAYDLLFSRTCLDFPKLNGKQTVDSIKCHHSGGNQLWKYFKPHKQLYHVMSKQCAEVGPLHAASSPDKNAPRQVTMAKCDPSNPLQRWTWDTSPMPGPSWRKDEAAGKTIV